MIYSYVEVLQNDNVVGYAVTKNGSKAFKANRFGIIEDEFYAQLVAQCFNEEYKSPTPKIHVGDIVQEIQSGLEGVVVFFKEGPDFEDHGFVEVYLKDKGVFEHYTWYQWQSYIKIIELYNEEE